MWLATDPSRAAFITVLSSHPAPMPQWIFWCPLWHVGVSPQSHQDQEAIDVRFLLHSKVPLPLVVAYHLPSAHL